MKKEIVIVGAGPAGITCALKLQRCSKESIIIDREKTVGGLAKTLEYKEGNLAFLTDIGPHRFFSKNKELYKLISGLLGKDWGIVNRQTRQFIEGKFYDYPINIVQALKNIGIVKAAQILISYICDGKIKYGLAKRAISNFEDYIIANFGRKLGEFNMLNYTEKIWGVPCNEIHSDWATQRIKGLSLITAAKNALLGGQEKNLKTLVDKFYYPKYGTGTIYEAMKKEIEKGKSKFLFETWPVEITHDKGRILGVKLKSSVCKTQEIKVKQLVSSIPMDDLLRCFSPKPPKVVLDSMKKLLWRSQVYLFITLDNRQVTSDNWIYFPEKKIIFGRLAEMKNFSSQMSPKGKTSLFIEFFCNEGDYIWNMDKDTLFKKTILQLEEIGFVESSQIRNYYHLKKRKVYPVYNVDYKENLKIVKDYLNSFENLQYIGRPGRFQYTNQDHSLEMGLLAAKSIVENKKYDLDKIGAEEEYFEDGELADESN